MVMVRMMAVMMRRACERLYKVAESVGRNGGILKKKSVCKIMYGSSTTTSMAEQERSGLPKGMMLQTIIITT